MYKEKKKISLLYDFITPMAVNEVLGSIYNVIRWALDTSISVFAATAGLDLKA